MCTHLPLPLFFYFLLFHFPFETDAPFSDRTTNRLSWPLSFALHSLPPPLSAWFGTIANSNAKKKNNQTGPPWTEQKMLMNCLMDNYKLYHIISTALTSPYTRITITAHNLHYNRQPATRSLSFSLLSFPSNNLRSLSSLLPFPVYTRALSHHGVAPHGRLCWLV